MRLNLAAILLVVGILTLVLESVDTKGCKGKGCNKKRSGRAKLGRLKGKKGRNKGKDRKPVAPFWKKGPPKTSEVIVREDREMTLNCGIKGRPNPTFSWMINGKMLSEINSTKIRQRRHRLVLKNTQMHNSGRYSCVANNSQGQLNFTFTVRVLENMPLIDIHVVDEPQNQTAQVGDTVIFVCRSHDWPTPRVHWARKTVANIAMELVTSPDNASDSTELVLHNVTKQDAGEYICFISNGRKGKQLSAQLKVIEESETLPFEPLCSLHVRRQMLSDHTRTCTTVKPVEMHYCMGSCGRSYYIPQLIVSDEPTTFHLNQTCKCCVGVVERLKIVELICPLGQTKRAFYTTLRECQCQACSTEDKAPKSPEGNDDEP